MSGKLQYAFCKKMWQHSGPGGWHFLSLPVAMSAEIRKLLQSEEEGWGRLKATASIGRSEWKTAIWFDTKRSTYLLPVKAEVRKKENLNTETPINVTLKL